MYKRNYSKPFIALAALGLAGTAQAGATIAADAGDYSGEAREEAREITEQGREVRGSENFEADDNVFAEAIEARMALLADRKAINAEADRAAQHLEVESATDLEGHAVVDPKGEKIGDIDRVAQLADTGDVVAVIGLDGVMGDNRKEVAVPLGEMKPATGEERVAVAVTKERLQQLKDRDPWDAELYNLDGYPVPLIYRTY